MKEATIHDFIYDFYIDYHERTSHYNVGSHYHPYYEIFYLVDGNCSTFINHSIYHLSSGDFVVIKPSEIHRMVYGTSPHTKRIAVFFSEAYIQALLSEDQFTKDMIFPASMFHLPTNLRDSFQTLLWQMLTEHGQIDSFSKPLLASYLTQLLSIIGRCPSQHYARNDLDETERAIEHSAQYICENFQNNISLSDAAFAAHMSPTYFSRKFKAVTGFGFKEYLTHIRIKEASILLKTTTRSITDIALDCGFADGNYFGDAFRKEKGVSPRLYRKMRYETL